MENREVLDRIVDDLMPWIDNGGAGPIRQTLLIAALIHQLDALVTDELRAVWKGVEWGESADGWDWLIEALREYPQQ